MYKGILNVLILQMDTKLPCLSNQFLLATVPLQYTFNLTSELLLIDEIYILINLKKQEGLNVIYAQIYLKIKTEKCTQVIINFSNDISKSIIVIRMICR